MVEAGRRGGRRLRLELLLLGLGVGLVLLAVAWVATAGVSALGTLAVGLLAGTAGLLVGRRLSGTLRGLTLAAARLGSGDLATPIPRAAGAELGELAATLEETRRRLSRLTTELRRRQAEAEAILTGVAEGVFSVDRDRRIRYLNPQTARLLGIRPEAALGRFCGEVLRPLGEDGVPPCDEHCPIVHARFRGAARATERLQLADGTQRLVVVTSAPAADELQVQIVADETEQEAARRLRDAVLANISHEFKTPLAAQSASLELLRDRLTAAGEVDPEVRGLVLALERGGLRLSQLIDNLLESVRIEAGSAGLRRRPLALDEVIEEAVEMTAPLFLQREQRVEVDLPYPLPELAGDAARLTQVFVNLLANANKFAPEASVVRVGALVTEGEVRLWVEDEGPGIPEAEGAGRSLFERFVRAPQRQPEPEASGLGLGLWIVQSIVERHGGRVETEAGERASRVVVALPRERAPATAVEAPA
jgi:signal transduction histidine kinase